MFGLPDVQGTSGGKGGEHSVPERREQRDSQQCMLPIHCRPLLCSSKSGRAKIPQLMLCVVHRTLRLPRYLTYQFRASPMLALQGVSTYFKMQTSDCELTEVPALSHCISCTGICLQSVILDLPKVSSNQTILKPNHASRWLSSYPMLQQIR